MNLRLCKIVITALSSVFFLIVVFNNLTDPDSNYQFVRHVLGMDTTFPGNTLMYRSITTPFIHKVFYASIIAWEALCCGLIGSGALRLWKARAVSTPEWRKAKELASIGLTASIILWYFGFITMGGEWYVMWQSKVWNGQEAAFRNFVISAVTLVLLNQADE